MSMRVKLADFGLAYQDIFEGQESQFNVRWAAPEIWKKIMEISEEDSDELSCSSSTDDDGSGIENNEDSEEGDDSKHLKIKDSSKTSSRLSKASGSRSGTNCFPFTLCLSSTWLVCLEHSSRKGECLNMACIEFVNGSVVSKAMTSFGA